MKTYLIVVTTIFTVFFFGCKNENPVETTSEAVRAKNFSPQQNTLQAEKLPSQQLANFDALYFPNKTGFDWKKNGGNPITDEEAIKSTNNFTAHQNGRTHVYFSRTTLEQLLAARNAKGIAFYLAITARKQFTLVAFPVDVYGQRVGNIIMHENTVMTYTDAVQFLTTYGITIDGARRKMYSKESIGRVLENQNIEGASLYCGTYLKKFTLVLAGKNSTSQLNIMGTEKPYEDLINE